MLFVDVCANNPLHPSSSKMGIIIVFLFILTAIYSNLSQYVFNHEVSPGLSIEG